MTTCLMLGSGMAHPLKMERPTMTLSLIRHEPYKGVVIGELSVNGKFECFTLEDEVAIIPRGSYKVTLYRSPKAKTYVPLIQVKNRKWIEIHPGNVLKNSEGCVLVGKDHTSTSLLESRLAFAHLMQQFSLPVVLVVS